VSLQLSKQLLADLVAYLNEQAALPDLGENTSRRCVKLLSFPFCALFALFPDAGSTALTAFTARTTSLLGFRLL
jgi:hypothetical protein